MVQDGEHGAQANLAGAILKALVSKMAPRWLKMAPIASWDPSWVFRGCLGRPWTPKNLGKPSVFKVFANACFRHIQALDGPLGPILAPLGPIWSQNDLQNGSPNRSKSTPENIAKINNTGPQNGSQNNSKWRSTLTGKS